MRIALSIDGGIASLPGLRKPVTLECDRLPAERSARLKALVDDARFFTATPSSTAPGADRRTFTVEIEDGPRCRTLRLVEPIGDAALRALVDEIRDCVRLQRG